MNKPSDLVSFIDYVFEKSGYDFRNYSVASLERRVALFRAKHRFADLPELQEALGREERLMRSFIENMTVQVTEMFRDPSIYRIMREQVIPTLGTYPRIKIWHAGCSNGAEVYSMAILLEECGLLDRTRIYATDINEESLRQAYDGVYAIKDMRTFTKNYQAAGGTGDFADYYRADTVSVIMDRRLKKNMTFAFHNLATDRVFTEAHLIVCRNVLIYFDQDLQNRTLSLFTGSLARRGFLVLGSKESLRFSEVAEQFEAVSSAEKIYRMKG